MKTPLLFCSDHNLCSCTLQQIGLNHGPHARDVKLRVVHEPGMLGPFSPPKRVTKRHLPVSFEYGGGETFPAFPVPAQPPFLSVKRSMKMRKVIASKRVPCQFFTKVAKDYVMQITSVNCKLWISDLYWFSNIHQIRFFKTQWGRSKMAAILKTAFLNAVS